MRFSLAPSRLLVISSLSVLALACSQGDKSKDDEAEVDANSDGVADDLGTAVDADKDGKIDTFKAGKAVDTDKDGKADAVS